MLLDMHFIMASMFTASNTVFIRSMVAHAMKLAFLYLVKNPCSISMKTME